MDEIKSTVLRLKQEIDYGQPCYPLEVDATDALGRLVLHKTFTWEGAPRSAFVFADGPCAYPVTVTIEDQNGLKVSEVVQQPTRQQSFDAIFESDLFPNDLTFAARFALVRRALRASVRKRRSR